MSHYISQNALYNSEHRWYDFQQAMASLVSQEKSLRRENLLLKSFLEDPLKVERHRFSPPTPYYYILILSIIDDWCFATSQPNKGRHDENDNDDE